MAREDERGAVADGQVLAVEDVAARGVDDRVVVGGRRRPVRQVPGQPRAAPAAEQHEPREVATREPRRAPHARRPGDDRDLPHRADVALERPQRRHGVEPRHDRAGREPAHRRAADRQDPAAAVEAHAHAAVEGGDAAVGLRVAQVRDAAAGRHRAVREGQRVDVPGGEPERGPLIVQPAERDRGAVAGRDAGQRPVAALDAAHGPGPRIDGEHGVTPERPARGSLARARRRRRSGGGAGVDGRPGRLLRTGLRGQHGSDERGRTCDPPARGTSRVCPLRLCDSSR